jgi:hypothetical protein
MPFRRRDRPGGFQEQSMPRILIVALESIKNFFIEIYYSEIDALDSFYGQYR